MWSDGAQIHARSRRGSQSHTRSSRGAQIYTKRSKGNRGTKSLCLCILVKPLRLQSIHSDEHSVYRSFSSNARVLPWIWHSWLCRPDKLPLSPRCLSLTANQSSFRSACWGCGPKKKSSSCHYIKVVVVITSAGYRSVTGNAHYHIYLWKYIRWSAIY